MRHDKRYDDLDTLSDYELVNDSQDIRGRPLVSADGQQYGVIEDLLVDKAHNRVTAIRLDDGRICAVEPLEIYDNAVVYGEAAVAHAKTGVASGAVVEEEVVPIVEERIAVGKRVAEHGRDISVRTRVVTDKVGEDVHLRKENVSVDKRSVDRPVSTADADALLKGKTVTMTERSEEAVVAKDAVVTDEVVIKKTAADKVEHIEETVRRTEVDIDKDGKPRR